MAGTNKALVCFWIAILLALSSDVEDVSSLDDCFPAVTLGFTKDRHCRKPCCNDDDTYSDWICKDFLCFCCKNFENPKSCSDP
ncbi:hypothetical protein HU200_054588 [Digitaria exilis]|uniref:Uncharacterized protein n=1 Tax=Digitaria exilis TaxID=1010633 RepID=A0A835E3W5_9POAL|nr:hypothetical protein HU200_054588 [Digitaria exilis]